MNIQQEALYDLLTNKVSKVHIEHFSSATYKLIAEKAMVFKRNKSVLASLDFLFNSANKIGTTKEEISAVEDIIYAIQKLKPSEVSSAELAELLLEDYKSSKIRELVQVQTKMLVEGNMLEVENISNKITSVSRLSLDNKDYLKNDIKNELGVISSRLELVDTGLLSDGSTTYPFSRVPVGSMITVLAKSGRGKSTLTLQAGQNLYLDGKSVLNINVELQKPVIMGRLRANLTGIPLQELSTQEFTTSEAEDANFCYDFVMKYQLSMEEALSILNKKGKEKAIEIFEAKEPRENLLKIVSAEDKATYEAAKEKGLIIDKLPNDKEILNLLEEHGESFDAVIIDLISEIEFTETFLSREQQLTNFARDIKSLAMEKSFIVFLVSQVEGVSFYGQTSPKYSKAIYQSSDLVIALMSTSEMEKEGLVGIVTPKARHASNTEVVLCNSDFRTMQITDTGDTVSVYDFEDAVNKENKKKNTEKK